MSVQNHDPWCDPQSYTLSSAQTMVWDVATLTWIRWDGSVTTAAGPGGGLTDAELRAAPLEVEVVAMSGGGLTDIELRATAVPMSLASVPSHPVTNAGTFEVQVSSAPTTAVTGTFWQATQPVSGPLTDTELRATDVPVSGTFWQATQPVSAAALPLPASAATDAKQDTGNASLASIDGKLTSGIAINAMPPVTAESSATATSDDPTYTDAQVAAFSQDLGGRLRTLMYGLVNDAVQIYIPGDVKQLSMTTEGRLRVSTAEARIIDSPFRDKEREMWGDLRPWDNGPHPYYDGSPWTNW